MRGFLARLRRLRDVRVSDFVPRLGFLKLPCFPFPLNPTPPPSPRGAHTVFVTGNAGKLKEVREILAGGPQQPFEVESRELDRQSGGRPLGLSPSNILSGFIDF